MKERIEQLEKRVTELERRIQEQPKEKFIPEDSSRKHDKYGNKSTFSQKSGH